MLGPEHDCVTLHNMWNRSRYKKPMSEVCQHCGQDWRKPKIYELEPEPEPGPGPGPELNLNPNITQTVHFVKKMLLAAGSVMDAVNMNV